MLERSSRERLFFAVQAVALPLGFFLLLSAGLFLLWNHSHRSEVNRLRVETRVVGELLRLRLESWIDARGKALELLTGAMETQDTFPPGLFRGIARRIEEGYEGFQAINWVDPDGTIRVVVPLKGNRAALGRNLQQHPDPGVPRALARARRTGHPCRSPIVPLLQGGKGFAAYFPVRSRRTGKLLGFVNGVFRVDEVLNTWFRSEELRDRFVFRIRETEASPGHGPGTVVEWWPSPAQRLDPRYTIELRVRLFDRPWQLAASPNPVHLAAVSSRADDWLLLLGLLLALVASVLLGDLGRRHILLRGRERRGRDLLDWAKTLHQVASIEDLLLLAHEQVIRHFGPVGTWIWIAPEKGDAEGQLVALPPGPGTHPVRTSCPCPSGTGATTISGPNGAETRPADVACFPPRLGYRATSWQPLVVAGQRIGTFGIGCTSRQDCIAGREGAALFRAIADQVAQVVSRIQFLEARRRLESQLQHVQKLESLGVLAGGIAHDFNNLLVGILGNADLALLSLPEEHDARRPLEGILRAGRRAADLCRQMLAYAGRGPMDRRLVDLGRLVQEMVELLRASAGRNVSLEMTFGEGLPLVEGDPTQLRQVVLNLVTNAAEAIEGCPGTVRIFLEAVPATELPVGLRFGSGPRPPATSTCVRLRVVDDGRGMDDEVRQRMFDPFFSTKRPGRGIGMAAVAGILRSHRAAIDVESAPGRGTTVTVWFPGSAGTLTELPPAPEVEENPWKGQGTVLVVDDEEPVREVGARMLGELGYEVAVAGDGIEALATLDDLGDRIRLVLLDLTMPRMDGRQCLARLRERWPDLPVILTSGWDEGGFREAPGPTTFLHKPWRRGELVAALREVWPG